MPRAGIGPETGVGEYLAGHMPQGLVEPMDLKDYFWVLIRRRWTIILFLLLVVTLVGIFTFTSEPIYKATTQILIERESPKILNIEDIIPIESTGKDFYQTQYKVLHSRAIAQYVIEELDLAEQSDFNPPSSGLLSKLFAASDHEPDEKESLEILIDRFLDNLRIQPIKDSRLVNIGFENRTPELAATVANSVARAYIEMNLEMKFGATKQAVVWLNRQIAGQKVKLEKSEQALQQYRVEVGLTSLGDKQQDIAYQRLSHLNSDLVRAESHRISVEERYRNVQRLMKKGVSLDTVPEVARNSQVQGLKIQEIKLISEISEMAQNFGEKHPKMIRARAELASLRKNIEKTAENLVGSLKNEYIVALRQEKRLREALAEQTKEMQTLSEKSIRYRVLDRDVSTNEQVYKVLLERFKEVTLAEDIKVTNVRVVDEASIPLGPVRPKKAINLRLALMVGLFGGVGLAFLQEYMDEALKNPEDVEHRLGVPTLATIPIVEVNGDELGEERVEWIVQAQPRSLASEAFHVLRANLLFSPADYPIRVVLVTSTIPGEGKTFTAVNLAVSLAEIGKRVLLIDADMRKSSMQPLFHLDNDEGLSNILTGVCQPRPQITSRAKNLHVLPCGPVPSNPSNLLASQAMETFLGKQRELYDFVILDSPPVGLVSDALVLGRISDGVIVVVKGTKTPRWQVKKAISALADLEIRILGVVLNLIDITRDRHTHYGHRYGDYYGYESDRKA
ncbi:MAG: polysaccharide biosynthesis tyrosine autokinase [Desulfobacterales bacterium]|nr:polysaccharide biosynthesis tyrosine autokinase [Desulfobacterales bacterium]